MRGSFKRYLLWAFAAVLCLSAASIPILAAARAGGEPDAVSGARGIVYTLLGAGKRESYEVLASAGPGGSVIPDMTSCPAGKTVSVKLTPEAGYAPASICVITAAGDSVEVVPEKDGYSFRMPACPVVVDASFQPTRVD